MSTKNASITAMKLGQDFISLGLKIQKREIALEYVAKRINVSAIAEINSSTDWAKDITALDLIAAMMEIQSVTQAGLARRLGVSRQFVSDVLNDKKPLTDALTRRIAKALGVKPYVIMSK